MTHVHVLTTGGTISSLPDETGSVSATLSGQGLMDELGVTSDVEVSSSVTTGSYNFDYDTLFELANDVTEILEDPEVKGIVLTVGTDTMEEIAFYLSLVTNSYQKAVVLTGAQLDPSHLTSDGSKNLQDAIYAVESEKLDNCGAVIVFAGFIHGAREVTKIDTNALEAFDSPNWGPIGRVDEGKVTLARQLEPRLQLEPVVLKPVALIKMAIGMDVSEFKQMTAGYEGVVIEGFGRGNAHHSISEEIKRLVDNEIPVIMTSRTSRGEVLPYYGAGGGIDIEAAGAWFAGDLTGIKARILLGTLLASDLSFDQMKEAVEKVSRP